MQKTDEIKTLILSWHWPPAQRASARVLGTLFRSARPGRFRVVTRSPLDAGSCESSGSGGSSIGRDGSDALECVVPSVRVPWCLPDAAPISWRMMPAVWRAMGAMSLAAEDVCRSWQPDRLMVVYPHRFGLLAGWRLSKRLRLPLVLYMHDLLAEGIAFRNPFRRAFWRWVDGRVLEDAWMIVVPTEEFADHYRRRGLSQVWALPHCVPEDVHPTPPPACGDTLKLLYSGLVYEPHIDAVRAFVSATRDMDCVDVSYHSNPDGCDGLMRDVGARWLSHDASVSALHDADVLVLLLGRNSPCPVEVQGCFPSKLMEYLAVGRPVLAIVPRGSFVDRFIREHGCGISVTEHDPASIRVAIERLRDRATRLSMSEAARETALKHRSADWMPSLSRRLRDGLVRDTSGRAYHNGVSNEPIRIDPCEVMDHAAAS